MSYTVVESRTLFDQAWVRIVGDTVEHHGRRAPYFYLESPIDSVATVALTADGQVVLTRQYRHPLGAVIYDLPAGRPRRGGGPGGRPPAVGGAPRGEEGGGGLRFFLMSRGGAREGAHWAFVLTVGAA